jgi:hypothetical protein
MVERGQRRSMWAKRRSCRRLVDERTALRRVATLVATALADRVYSFDGDTLTARVVSSGGPARVEGARRPVRTSRVTS